MECLHCIHMATREVRNALQLQMRLILTTLRWCIESLIDVIILHIFPFFLCLLSRQHKGRDKDILPVSALSISPGSAGASVVGERVSCVVQRQQPH